MTVYMIAENPKIDVKARAERSFIRERGRSNPDVNTMIFDVLPFHWSGKPAWANNGVKTSPRIPEYITEAARHIIAMVMSTTYFEFSPIVRPQRPCFNSKTKFKNGKIENYHQPI